MVHDQPTSTKFQGEYQHHVRSPLGELNCMTVVHVVLRAYSSSIALSLNRSWAFGAAECCCLLNMQGGHRFIVLMPLSNGLSSDSSGIAAG